MLVNDVAINRNILEEFLVLLPNQTRDSIRKLLNPADPQDVPRSIELVQAVGQLHSLDTSQFNPSQKKTIEALQLIGRLFHCMVEPFVNASLSLTEQMEYLSEYSHLALMLYRRNGRAFMSNQLYGDSQVMVKNTFFYLAKQQLMDPRLPVLLMLTGDDRLENLFGRVRMQGAHNSGVDLKTLMDRLAAAMDLCRLFTIHPSWDQGHRQLNYSRLEHCDHLKPASWKGNLIASSCDLKLAWFTGRSRAESVLKSHHVAADFTEVFSHPNVDMLRPFPDGIYPGISTDPDPSIPTISKSPIMTTLEPVEDDGDEDYEDELEGDIDVEMDDILDEPPAPAELQAAAGEDWIEFEGNKFHKASLLRVIFCSDFVRKSKERLERVRAYTIDFQKKTTEESDEALLGVSLFILGDLFTTLIRTGQTVALAVLQATGIDHKSRKVSSVSAAELSLEAADIKISGQVLHLVTPSSPITISAPSNSPSEPMADQPSSSSTLQSLSPTGITNSSIASQDIPMSQTDDASLKPDQPPSSVTAATITEPPFPSRIFWIGDYIKFNALKVKKDKGKQTATSASEKVSRNALVLTTPGYMIEPVSGLLVGATNLSPADANAINQHGLAETWYFDAEYLRELAGLLWEKVTANKWKVLEAGISFNDLFPYGAGIQDGLLSLHALHFDCIDKNFADIDRFIVATESIQEARENQKSLCFTCNKMIPKDSSKRRLHIGKHILKALRMVSETPAPVNAVSLY
jgi:hypothetical protein